MRKFTPIPIILMVIVSIVLASGVLFPDTPTLPRLPTGSGTIGGILSSLFDSDGTARNTRMLSGVYASGYLHNMDCSSEPLNKVWVGIDADGGGICGNVAKLIGILTEQGSSVTVSRDGGLTYTGVSTGTPLYEGDLIHSDASGTGMIRFAADSSLIRFAPNTDLELNYGTLGADTVAEVILNNGRLWGRILSATGVNLGGGGLVTGVRGTSIDIQKIASNYTMNIVSSTNTNNVLQEIHSFSVPSGALVQFEGIERSTILVTSKPPFGSGTIITYASGALGYEAIMITQNSDISYTNDPWIRENTISDITYMSNLLSGSTDSIISSKLNSELDTTIIAGNTGITISLLQGGLIADQNDIILAGKLLNEENETVTGEPTTSINERKAKRLDCKRKGKTYFPDLTDCAGSWNTLALTNFGGVTPSNLTLIGKKSKWNFTASGGSTNDLKEVGGNGKAKYLAYNLTSDQFNNLRGKTITINYSGILNSSPNTTILSLGSIGSFRMQGTSWISPTGGSINVAIPGEITIRLPTVTMNGFVFGNNSALTSLYPLGVTIQSIEISN